jgi:hypothetical protein
MNSVLFWDITRRCRVFADVSGQRIGPMFKGKEPEKKIKLSFLLGLLILEHGTDTLSRNIGKQLPH